MKKYLNLPKPLYFMFIGVVFMNLGSYIWPLFALMSKDYYGLTEFETATVLGIMIVISLIGTLIGGNLTDYIGRKLTFVVPMTLSAFLYGSAAFFTGWTVIVLLTIGSFLAGIGSSSTGAIITDLTNEDERKTAFTLNYIALNIGFAFGPLLGGIFYDAGMLRVLFLGDGITTFIFAMLVFIFVPETKPNLENISKHDIEKEEAVEGNLFVALIRRPELLKFSIVIILIFMTMRQFTFGLPKFIETIYDNPGSTYGILMFANSALVVVATGFLVDSTRKLGTSRSIVLGSILYAIGFGMLAMITSLEMLILSTIIWTLGEILVSTNSSVYIANHSPITHRGRFNSVFKINRNLGGISGIYIGAFILNSFDSYFPFWIVFGLIPLTAGIIMYMIVRVESKEVM